ncbi:hypothetical protein [Spongiactinospora sp. TRM90649]|uniref:hypothetical protein n=1 Tax=Spongiactinospora sp. TRM90649 TaxID=3031114 RepID=UPI0023F950C7|nr:hypothetical protein [Spongiactinospora sp. TRM90649]MDF5757782.1 hypothetical protein [Spongiactinospora sp. TRM90649]
MRKETKMHGKRLLFASPLIAALAFGSIGTSQASVFPTASVSADDSRVTATSSVVPPICKFPEKKQRKICAEGYADGFAEGRKCGQPRRQGRISDDEAYDIGFNAGFNAGQRKCRQ